MRILVLMTIAVITSCRMVGISGQYKSDSSFLIIENDSTFTHRQELSMLNETRYGKIYTNSNNSTCIRTYITDLAMTKTSSNVDSVLLVFENKDLVREECELQCYSNDLLDEIYFVESDSIFIKNDFEDLKILIGERELMTIGLEPNVKQYNLNIGSMDVRSLYKIGTDSIVKIKRNKIIFDGVSFRRVKRNLVKG